MGGSWKTSLKTKKILKNILLLKLVLFCHLILWCPKPRRVDNFFENKNFTKFSYRNRYTFGKIKPNNFGKKNTNFKGDLENFQYLEISFKYLLI